MFIINQVIVSYLGPYIILNIYGVYIFGGKKSCLGLLYLLFTQTVPYNHCTEILPIKVNKD